LSLVILQVGILYYTLKETVVVRYVTGEVSTIVMNADEEIVESRSRLESVETLLHDERIGADLKLEIRQHFQASKSSNSVDMAALFRLTLPR
jgi:hypothetical protein